MTASSAESIGANSAAPEQLFVINLAASTSPMALSHPSSPELKRYTFFVSRQREDGRERFRLHMGYFATQEEAEELLPTVRDIYPAAWAGPAPTTGMGRRGRIAPGSVVAVKPAAVPNPIAAPAKATAPAQAAAPAAPVASPAAPARVAAPAVAGKPAAAAQPAVGKPADIAAAARPAPPAAPVAAKVATLPPAAARKGTAARLEATAATSAPAKNGGMRPAASVDPLDTMSNVRDVLAQLSESHDDEGPTVRMPVPEGLAGAPAAPELSATATLRLLEPEPAKARAPAPEAPSLPPLKNPFEGLENEPEVRLITPEDTQTLTDIRIDRQNNAPPCFAVQLVWSVSPIDVATLPHLAIFDAYTLYNVEGNRQGRKWYGLRLGFFSDPNSATQVANYVRSDYRAVAVVPVSQKERDRAKGGSPSAAPAADEPKKTTEKELVREEMQGFELLPDDRPPPPRRDIDDATRRNGAAPASAKDAAAARAPQKEAVAPRPDAPPGMPKGRPVGKRVVARRRPPPIPQGKTVSAGVAGPEVLESTLEILGASTLSLEEGGREVITDAAARKPAARKPARSRFSRLLSRLAGG
jgi:hypothetical protein